MSKWFTAHYQQIIHDYSVLKWSLHCRTIKFAIFQCQKDIKFFKLNKGKTFGSKCKNNCSVTRTLHFDNVWDAQTYQSFINIKISQFAKYPCLNQILIFRPIKVRALFSKNYFVRCCTSCDMTLNWLGDSIDKNFFCWFKTM